jgi:hypothetical protein
MNFRVVFAAAALAFAPPAKPVAFVHEVSGDVELIPANGKPTKCQPKKQLIYLCAGDQVRLEPKARVAVGFLGDFHWEHLKPGRPDLDKPMPKAEALAEAKKWLRELSLEEANRLAAALVQDVNRQDRGKGEPLNLVVPPADPTAADEKADKPFAHPRYWWAFILIGDPN